MKTTTGDIFKQPTRHNNTEAICVTTNGMMEIRRTCCYGPRNCLIGQQQIHVSRTLAEHITANGNVPGVLGCFDGVYVISFPTKNDWRDNSSIGLIENSAKGLVKIADELHLENIWLTKPGCANGHLDWNNVRAVIEPILDDRFTVIDF